MEKRWKVTQEDMVGRLARQGLMMTQGQIAKAENGGRPINDFELVAFARALGVSVQQIVDLAFRMRRQTRTNDWGAE